jgi:mRNA interferase MazF
MVVVVSVDPTVSHEIRNSRPFVVIQNDIGNANSHLTIVAAIEGAENGTRQHPLHVPVSKGEGGLPKDSIVLCEQIRTVDETRFSQVLGKLSDKTMREVGQALRISLAL